MILSIHNQQNVTPLLIDSLQRIEAKYGQSYWVTLTLSEGAIRQVSGSVEELSIQLSNYLVKGGIAFSHSNAGQTPHAKVRALDNLAIVYAGMLDNAPSIRNDLFEMGYDLIFDINEEIVLMLLTSYLEAGLSPFEAMKLLFLRLQGRFVVMGLFTEPEMLIVGSRGYPLALGVCHDSFLVGFETQMFKSIFPSVMALEEDNPMVLYSV